MKKWLFHPRYRAFLGLAVVAGASYYFLNHYRPSLGEVERWPEETNDAVVQGIWDGLTGNPITTQESPTLLNDDITVVLLSDGENPATGCSVVGKEAKELVEDAVAQCAEATEALKSVTWLRVLRLKHNALSQLDLANSGDLKLGDNDQQALRELLAAPTAKVLPENLRRTLYKIERNQSPVATALISASHFVEEGKVLALNYGIRTDVPLSQVFDDFLKYAGDYLVKTVNDDGTFDQTYLPHKDKEQESSNILRHAGTIYALMELYDVIPNDKYQEAAVKAFYYLKSMIKACPQLPNSINRSESMCVVEDDEVKLGGNALAVLAWTNILKHGSALDQGSAAELHKLVDRMVMMQDAQGNFTAHKQIASTGKVKSFSSRFYPGEAIYGLAAYGKVFNRPQLITTAAANAASYIINNRDKGKTLSELTHDFWLLYGLRDVYAYDPKPEFLAHARIIVDAILEAQNDESQGSLRQGAWPAIPRSAPTATRIEGLMAAHELFNAAKDATYAQKTLAASLKAVSFLSHMLVWPEEAIFFPQPRKVLGGVKESVTAAKIRIDFVQHGIAAVTALRRNTTQEQQNLLLNSALGSGRGLKI